MKNTPFILLILCSLLFFQCDDCVCDLQPLTGAVEVKLSTNDEQPEVLVTIFQGRIENKDTLLTEYVTKNRVRYYFEAGVYYSATAHYLRGGRNYIAIDGKNMTTGSDDCDCAYAQDISLDLRLRD